MATTMREKLLKILFEHEGDFVSGQKISELLGCSRTAIWKHIEELRKNGYPLEAVQKKGYRIVKKPDKLTANEIEFGLNTKQFGRQVFAYDSVDSTQQVAKQLAYEDAKEGAIVVSEEQTLGRGRLNRKWVSNKGEGIYFSLILRPKISLQQAPQLTLLAAVAVVRGIERATGLKGSIKWPNDVLFNNKKCVGILTEMQAEADQIHSIIIGIGINVNHQSFPEEIKDIATSLRIELGKPMERATILQRVLEEMEELYLDYIENGFAVVKLLWESYAISLHKMVTARTIQGSITGFAQGITDSGVLLLEDENGIVHQIYSADIEMTSND